MSTIANKYFPGNAIHAVHQAHGRKCRRALAQPLRNSVATTADAQGRITK
jgi:hypothetical protein